MKIIYFLKKFKEGSGLHNESSSITETVTATTVSSYDESRTKSESSLLFSPVYTIPLPLPSKMLNESENSLYNKFPISPTLSPVQQLFDEDDDCNTDDVSPNFFSNSAQNHPLSWKHFVNFSFHSLNSLNKYSH